MVRNLIQNAEEHADQHITLSITDEHDTVRLAVTDDGPGIPAAQRDSVFERFVRLDTARTRDGGGTGLGLAIVHDVVAGHHGRVTITDTDPHGATITVELPASLTHGIDPPVEPDARAATRPARAPRST